MQAEPSARRWYASLYVQVLVAIVIGVLLGHYAPETAVTFKPLGDGFIKVVKMMIGPVIFCTVVSGIVGMESMKSVGKTGVLALLYFEVLSTIALIIGLVVVNVVKPGAGMNIDVTTLQADKVAGYAQAAQSQNLVDYLLNIIPSTLVDAFAKGEILQILLVALLFGFALHGLGERTRLIAEFIERL